LASRNFVSILPLIFRPITSSSPLSSGLSVKAGVVNLSLPARPSLNSISNFGCCMYGGQSVAAGPVSPRDSLIDSSPHLDFRLKTLAEIAVFVPSSGSRRARMLPTA
jgi:hypothetical protein